MTIHGGNNPACAACKYQRRKCSDDCLFAPYFPASKYAQFESVHNLFGVAHIAKTLKRYPDRDLRDDAVSAMIFEAEMHRKFPVGGCYEAIRKAALILKRKEEEYRHLRQLLELKRSTLASAAIDPQLPFSGNINSGFFNGGATLPSPIAAIVNPRPPWSNHQLDNLGMNNDGLFNGVEQLSSRSHGLRFQEQENNGDGGMIIHQGLQETDDSDDGLVNNGGILSSGYNGIVEPPISFIPQAGQGRLFQEPENNRDDFGMIDTQQQADNHQGLPTDDDDDNRQSFFSDNM